MKKNRKFLFIFLIIIITSIIGITIAFSYNNKPVTLIQLSPQSSRQMMGYLLKTHSGKIIVIDGGTIEDANNLIKQIYGNGGKVDYWFLTHTHDDHVGAFVQIINNTNIEVKNIYASVNEASWYEKNEPLRVEFTKKFLNTLNSDKVKNKVIEPALNQKIKIDNIKIEILGIKNPEITENAGNEQSMVFSINTGKTKLLILGDAGKKISEKLLINQKEKLKSDIVQMSHHGQQGATQQLYEAIKPKICLWPTPEWLWNNDIGKGINTGEWKTLETRAWMEQLKVQKNYIAKDGDTIIELK